MTTVSVRLDDRLVKNLDGLAKATERTRTFLINKALKQFLEESADYQIALDRLRDKDDAILSAAEMKKRLG